MERAVSGRSDDERSKRTAPQRRVHRRALAGRRAHHDESGASGEVVVEGAFAERSRGVSDLSVANYDVWRGWWLIRSTTLDCGMLLHASAAAQRRGSYESLGVGRSGRVGSGPTYLPTIVHESLETHHTTIRPHPTIAPIGKGHIEPRGISHLPFIHPGELVGELWACSGRFTRRRRWRRSSRP